jgi:DNA-binding MarR family transcriptional regulator
MKPSDASLHLDLGHLALFTGQRINQLVREELARLGHADARDTHGFVFQHLVEGSRSISSLAERMGISQQAASKRVAEMVEMGYVEIDPASRGRTRLVAIAPRGWDVIQQARAIRAMLHADLHAQLDPQDIATASTLLRQVLERLGGLEAISQRRVREPS